MSTLRIPVLVLAATSVASIAGGCVRYEYDLLQPPDLACHVGTKEWMTFRRDELEYRLRTADNRLVVLIYNRGQRTVKLSGADSAAVDPHGESHPLQGRTVPPGTHAKLILPPPPPEVHSYGAPFAFGVGVGYGHAVGPPYHDGLGFGSAAYDNLEPRYYTVYDPNDRTYFEWPGETDVRLLLAYTRDGADPFQHEFIFRRRKM